MIIEKKSMTIKEAKEEIKNTVIAYSVKDEYGEYKIPVDRQRPVCLIGPPGLGKTAIMNQITAELGIGFVGYSMTHHTRQSALGLPLISTKVYGGKTYNVSEYTMSEIIASVYKKIEEGYDQGILFLDEINCVSETLAAPMLQFFQKKEFGGHKVPNGWIVVTAGNPIGKYNNSVREFDVVTLDRLKKIEISCDYEAWKEYAIEAEVHRSITSYLEFHNEKDFYVIEFLGDTKNIVTARAWTDLSDMIKLYEEKNIPVTKSLIEQYLQKEDVANRFSMYYDLYNEYKSDYQIGAILEGKADDGIKARAKNAKLGERVSVVALLMDGISKPVNSVYNLRLGLMELASEYRIIKTQSMLGNISIKEALEQERAAISSQLEKSIDASAIKEDDKRKNRYVLSVFAEVIRELEKRGTSDRNADIALLTSDFKARKDELEAKAGIALSNINNAIEFVSSVYGNEKPTLMLTTELTTNKATSIFLANFKSVNFLKHVDELKLSNRKLVIDSLIEKLKL